METFSVLLAICAGISPVTGEFPHKGQVTQSFDVFIDLRLNKQLSKQSWGWWFEMPSRPLWRHCNEKFELRYMAPIRINNEECPTGLILGLFPANERWRYFVMMSLIGLAQAY